MSTTLGKRVRDENNVEGSVTKKQRITPTLIPFASVDLNIQSVPAALEKTKVIDISMENIDDKENGEPIAEDLEEEDEVVGLYEDDPNEPLVNEEADDFGLQSEETTGFVDDGAEPEEAASLAQSLGLKTEEALSKLGNAGAKTSGFISAYSTMIDQDPQTKSVYDEMTKEIEETENKLREGIVKIHQSLVEGSGIALTRDSVDYVRNILEKYIKVIADAAVVHAQHRQHHVVLLHNILEAFKLLGVTMYWPSEVDLPEDEEDDEDEEAADEDAADADSIDESNESDEEEEEENVNNKTNDEADNEDESKESKFNIDVTAFRRVADAVMEPEEDEEDIEDDASEEDEEDEAEWVIQESALEAMQASAEEFTSQLIESALKMAEHHTRKEISPADLRFILTLWQTTPGGSDLVKRIRL